jgi:HD superfamily phosphohydrolase
VEIIRDPLWNNVRVDATTLSLVDTPVFQRLRYVRQLGSRTSCTPAPRTPASNMR